MSESQTRTYSRADSVVFCKTEEEFGGLSNMAGGYPLEVNGVAIRTSEALYQACRFPHLPEVQQEILDQKSPMTAKMKSKPHRDKTREDWERVRLNIMRWCLRVKLVQHREKFGGLLLATGDMPVVEESKRDGFWGAKAEGEDGLVGTNALGRLLMELRKQIREEGAECLRGLPSPGIPNFQLLGQPIASVVAVRASGDLLAAPAS